MKAPRHQGTKAPRHLILCTEATLSTRLAWLTTRFAQYFRVRLDDDPFGRPDTAASRYTAESWKESEFSSRPLTALTDPLFASRPGSRGVTGGRPGSRGLSRPMTGGGSRPLTAAEIEVIPEFEHTEEEEQYAMGYNAAAITIQSTFRGSKSRESSRPGTSEPPPIPAAIPMSKEQVRGQQSRNSSDGEGSLSDNVDLAR